MNRNKRLVVCAAVLAAGILGTNVGAQGKSKGKGHDGNASGSSAGTSAPVAVVFRDSDRVTYRDYFVTHRITAQPLPPGIAKRVARGKPLPPGIAKRAVPAELVALGPRVDRDVSFAIVGNVVVASKGGVVID